MEMLYVLLTTIIGSSIGLVFHLIYHENSILVPCYFEYVIYFGFLMDILTGGLAACVGLVLFDVTTIAEVVITAIITAISGQTFVLHQTLARERSKNLSMSNIEETIQKIKC
ncbi:DUF4257 domain-containing protein [Bacillus toyonensis]|uniref:DUF4257 domain-containing protein n=1 Tax=Bacillus toyonensis TaxID=155322 RepID=A0A2A8HCD2_9BACI|nr:DUF4257 domain-containing protein [Bacillus toyonensis]PEQ03554.1 hypothetical protein CN585_18155 [Bacillus toyonensis]